tara:strand:- start:22835 stop:24082 length:1248 start_codon:yes stop_codon:yes gene_type:complete
MCDDIKSLENKIMNIRNDFPIFKREINGHQLSYLDNAASSQKPSIVLDKINSIYSNSYSNVHRGVHTLSMEATQAYESVRNTVANFINASNHEEIIYTKGTTDSINLFCQGWAKSNLKKGDKVVLSEVEHHANLVPWFMLRDEIGIVIEFIPVGSDYLLDMNIAEQVIDQQTKIVSISHISNSLGTIVPIKEIIEIAHKKNAIVLVDGAQSVPHETINVSSLDIDVLVFSAHKMCGPTGVGILWAKKSILDKMEPVAGGGDMISSVTFDGAKWNEIPYRFEAGTPNIVGVIGLGAAIDYLNVINFSELSQFSHHLSEYARNELSKISEVEILGPNDPKNRSSLFSFVINNIHPHDVAQVLDAQGVAIRAGHHCAQPTLNKFGFSSTARASFYLYNNIEDAKQLVDGVHSVISRFT